MIGLWRKWRLLHFKLHQRLPRQGGDCSTEKVSTEEEHRAFKDRLRGQPWWCSAKNVVEIHFEGRGKGPGLGFLEARRTPQLYKIISEHDK